MTRDLDDLVLVEIHGSSRPTPRSSPIFRSDSKRSARLYALGLTRIVSPARSRWASERLTFEGATGRVTLVDGRHFTREGRFAAFRSGQLAPLDVAR